MFHLNHQKKDADWTENYSLLKQLAARNKYYYIKKKDLFQVMYRCNLWEGQDA